MHIIDHYSKYLFGELLINKESNTILDNLKKIFFSTSFPKELCSDNGKEFRNKNLSNFLENNNVKEIHGLPRKPHSQGACERVHQTISKDLIATIYNVPNYNFNKIENDYKKAIFNYNNIKNHSTKFKPSYLYFNNTKELREKINSKILIKMHFILN